MSTRSQSLLAVGHVTTDLIDSKAVFGGSALYAAVQARALGLVSRVFTAAAREWEGRKLVRTFETKALLSESTTTFEYQKGAEPRRARVMAVAAPLDPTELPPGWERSEIALLCPVLGEVDTGFAAALQPRLLGVTPQGWLRRLGEDGWVESAHWDEAPRVLARADAVFFSEQDVPEPEALAEEWSRLARAVVVTRGARGATVRAEGTRFEVAAAPAREVDATGAGDVFATAYLVAVLEGAAARDAAQFAAAAAACAVEAPGVGGIRGRAVIEGRRAPGVS